MAKIQAGPDLEGVPEDWHDTLLDLYYGLKEASNREPLLHADEVSRLSEELERIAEAVREVDVR